MEETVACFFLLAFLLNFLPLSPSFYHLTLKRLKPYYERAAGCQIPVFMILLPSWAQTMPSSNRVCKFLPSYTLGWCPHSYSTPLPIGLRERWLIGDMIAIFLSEGLLCIGDEANVVVVVGLKTMSSHYRMRKGEMEDGECYILGNFNLKITSWWHKCQWWSLDDHLCNYEWPVLARDWILLALLVPYLWNALWK